MSQFGTLEILRLNSPCVKLESNWISWRVKQIKEEWKKLKVGFRWQLIDFWGLSEFFLSFLKQNSKRPILTDSKARGIYDNIPFDSGMSKEFCFLMSKVGNLDIPVSNFLLIFSIFFYQYWHCFLKYTQNIFPLLRFSTIVVNYEPPFFSDIFFSKIHSPKLSFHI